MKQKRLVIAFVIILIAVLTVFAIYTAQYNLKRKQMDTLYTYFHKIQDSIKAKHYPINIDSLKTVVYDQRNTISIYSKLKVLENSVKSFHSK